MKLNVYHGLKKRFDLFARHLRIFFWVNFPPFIHLGPQVFFAVEKEKFLPTGGRTGQPKVLQEVLADLKVFDCVMFILIVKLMLRHVDVDVDVEAC